MSGADQPGVQPLEGNQRLLYEQLVSRDGAGDLAAMYRGALAVLADTSNPDRVAQAAHSLRELMEKLPRLDHGDTARGSMTTQAKTLGATWLSYRDNAEGALDEWTGQTVGPALLAVLRAVDTFVSWIERNTLSRAAQAQRVVRHLQVSGYSAPPAEATNAKIWKDLHSNLENISHHRVALTDIELRVRLAQLEEFLLSLWVPETTKDFAELDEIIGGTDA
jgi:hypothetical protein